MLLESLRSLFRIDLVDPRFTSVVIVAVHLSPDGATARIAWASRKDDPSLPAALDRATGFVRSRLADSLNWKRTPALRFISLGVLPEDAS